MHYADTSALVKLVVPERESAALHAWIRSDAAELATSDLTRTELIRAVRRSEVDVDAPVRAREVLTRLTMVSATADVFERAALIDPAGLRSLDAVHLATAMVLGDELEGIVTYDDRLAQAAQANGITVVAPS